MAGRSLDLPLGLIAVFPSDIVLKLPGDVPTDWSVRLNQGVAEMTERLSLRRRRMIKDKNARGLSTAGSRRISGAASVLTHFGTFRSERLRS